MSDRALPLVFINLGGEMLYVLDQRLNAQKIQNEKARKIMGDIIVNMFSDGFLDEIFRPQELCSRRALRTIFERLAHTSIMRLNETSMDKLFDLMTMAVKYQMCLCSRPREVLLTTLNHFDSIRNYVVDMPNGHSLMQQAFKRIYKTYGNMSECEFQQIRQTMLQFFQDLRIKVSIFLKDKVQNWNGGFVFPNGGQLPNGFNAPGTIVYYDERDDRNTSKIVKFNTGTSYKPADKEGSIDEFGDRGTKLGLNIYAAVRMADTTVQPPPDVEQTASRAADMDSNLPDPKGKAQLDLLCRLIGTQSKHNADFKLNLFNDEEEEFIYSTKIKPAVSASSTGGGGGGNVISFDQSKRQRDQRLNNLLDEFNEDDRLDNQRRQQRKSTKNGRGTRNDDDEDEDDDDDLCAMMDRMSSARR